MSWLEGLKFLVAGLLCAISSSFLHAFQINPLRGRSARRRGFSQEALFHSISEENERQVDVIVIGAGVGGLSCAALSARYGFDTLCVEAHDTPGGCAHSFDRYSSASKTIPFRFDSGPSMITGLSSMSTNPLRQVLDALDVADTITWKVYDGWLVHDNADGKTFRLTTGDNDAFERALIEKAGPGAGADFGRFKKELLAKRGLARASAYIPPFALRGDLSAVASLAMYTLKLLSIGFKGALLTGPFSAVMDQYNVRDPFVRKWFDYLAFALSGLDASHTQAAPVAYMLYDLHSDGGCLVYPMGGVGALVNALTDGLEKHGGRLQLNSRVEHLLLSDGGGRAVCSGVVLEDGTRIRARRGVVSNAPLWNLAQIVDDSTEIDLPSGSRSVLNAASALRQQANDMHMTDSFMHLHLGIPKNGLPDDLECHHSVLDFSIDVTAEQNMVIISIPTVFDPSLAPPGYHIVHAYTAACDSFSNFEQFLENGQETGKVGTGPNTSIAATYRKSKGYKTVKDEKAKVLWNALERVIPDIRKRARRRGSIAIVGTPLTHRRYNQRFRGTYGPAPAPGKFVWELAGAKTPIDGLLLCGDSAFPGIGLPGVAASGTIAANTLASVRAQTQLMKELRAKGALQ